MLAYLILSNPSAVRSVVQAVGAGVKQSVKQARSHAPVAAGGSSYRDIARQAALDAGIPVPYFLNQINQESGFNPNARGAAGEVGIAQFMPSTAAGLGIDPSDPVQSLKGAAQMMGRYYRSYGRNYAMALGGYNCGGGCMAAALKYWNWGCHIPGSTRQYIYNIMEVRVC